MSELKAFVARNIDDGTCDPVPCVEVYLKSEADKAIAEQKDKLQNVSSLLNQTREWLLESQKLHKKCADNAVKVIRHQKYKRCLAMYRYCSIKALYELDFKGNDVEWKWYSKWMHKWFKLAKKFKPNKE